MNPSSRRSLALVTLSLLAVTSVPAAPAGTPAKADARKNVDRFVRTKQRIDALLQHRMKSEPLPTTRPDPFQLTSPALPVSGSRVPVITPPAGSEPALPAGSATVDAPPLTGDAEILARHASGLILGGIVEFNGRVQLIINQTPRKEGDLLVIRDKDDILYLQVIRLTPRELTLGYKDAVQVIPLKGS
jgi:hypothetical protein